MGPHDFDESKWVADLGTALELLAQNASEGVLRASRRVKHLLTFDQCRELAQLAKHNAGAEDDFKALQVKLNCFPTEAMAILLDHPVVRRALPDSSEDGVIQQVMLEEWDSLRLSELLSRTMKTVLKAGGKEAAFALNRFLTLGDNGNLRGYEMTVFDELEVNGRADVGESAFLAPYDDVKEAYSLPDHEKTSSRSLRSIQATPATVFVREFSWRIAIGPLPTNRGSIIKPEYPFKVSYENIIDLLSIVTGKPLTAPLQYIQALGQGHDTMITKQSVAGMRRGARHLLSDHEVVTFREFMRGWEACTQRHDAVELAIARLADSFSRTGRFELEDRILDTATALEILYELGGSELKYKLATRGACFLGDSDEESKSIMKRLKTFYDQRSAIVHNGKPKISRRTVAENLSDVSDLACRTLHKLLRDGQPSDWDELVVSNRRLHADS